MKIKQKLMVFMCLSAFSLSACDDTALTSKEQETHNDVVTTEVAAVEQITDITELTGDPFDTNDLNNDFDKPNSVLVTLGEQNFTTDGTEQDGIKIEKTKVTITKAGEYFISGTCSDGQIIVDTPDQEAVKLVLNQVTLNNNKGCPLYIKQAGKTIINVAGGTSNSLTDSGDYKGEEDGVTAAIFALSDLTFNGEGQLTVIGNYQDAVACNGDLKITAGTETFQAKEDAVVAAKGVSVKNGSFNVLCGGNGIKTTSANGQEGFIGIESGNFTIASGRDVLNATGNIYICNGSFTGTAGGGSATTSLDDGWGSFGGKGLTAKGIKAEGDIQIHGGSISIDAIDDAVYSKSSVLINTGCLMLTSGDDGVVAGKEIEVNGGSVTLGQCFEGFECSSLSMNGGYIDVTAVNDGINVANGNDASASAKRKGSNGLKREGTGKVTLNNTCINIKSKADAIDVAGDLEIAGGAVRMCGGTDAQAQGVDCSGNYSIQGGAIVAAGNHDMAEPKDSGQPVLVISYQEKQPADSAVCIKDAKGKVVYAFCMATEFDKVLVSQTLFTVGQEYTICKASITDSGAVMFGEVQEAVLNIGEEIARVKIGNGVTKVK